MIKTIQVYTADQKRLKVGKIASRYFPDGWTIHPNLLGGWRDPETGKTITERALMLEIHNPPLFNNTETIRRLCKDIKILNNQKAVLVVEIGSDGKRLTYTI